MIIPKDFQKLQSPFEREEVKNIGYVCVPKFRREFNWILDKDKVIATEKFDGTCTSVVIQDGKIVRILNRMNLIDIWKSKDWFYRGIKRAIDENKFNPDLLPDCQIFGELLAEDINSNPYQLTAPLWLPFDYIKEHYYFKFYYAWLEEKKLCREINVDEELYNAFRELFMELKSLWFRKRGIEKEPEGIVFHNKETGEMCKLRGNMWDFHKGIRHKGGVKNGKGNLNN
jgi:hypothetical protein